MGKYDSLMNKIAGKKREAASIAAKASTQDWNSRRDSLSSKLAGSRTKLGKGLKASSNKSGADSESGFQRADRIREPAERAERRLRSGARLLGASYEPQQELIEKSLLKRAKRIGQLLTKGSAASTIASAKRVRKELGEKDPKRIDKLGFGDRKFLATNRNNHLKLGNDKWKDRSGKTYSGNDNLDSNNDRGTFARAKFTVDKKKPRDSSGNLRFQRNEEFDIKDFVGHLLESHSEEEVRAFLENDFEELLISEGMIADACGGEKKGLFAKKYGIKPKKKEVKEDLNEDIISRIKRLIRPNRKYEEINNLLKKDNERIRSGGESRNREKIKAILAGKSEVKEEVEMINEIKMKLKPGQKLKPKEYAKMKADVLAKQKAQAAKKAEKKSAPVVKKAEVVDPDDSNRNSMILKGKFPWGELSPQLTKSVVSKLKQIEKPQHRQIAQDMIWKSKAHVGSLLAGDIKLAKPKPEKRAITLPKITGVNK